MSTLKHEIWLLYVLSLCFNAYWSHFQKRIKAHWSNKMLRSNELLIDYPLSSKAYNRYTKIAQILKVRLKLLSPSVYINGFQLGSIKNPHWNQNARQNVSYLSYRLFQYCNKHLVRQRQYDWSNMNERDRRMNNFGN